MIRLRGFSKSWGPIHAVDDLSLEIRPGEVAALVGPNGSGKTTTLKAVAGLLWPTAGEVLIAGVPADRPAARRAVSFLPQKVAFPPALTGREVVEFFRRLRRASPGRTSEVLRFASLEAAADRVVGTYSGGMIQRLGLAVAALDDAAALVLDEPTSSLDADGLRAFDELIGARRRQGRTVLFSSHQLGDIERLADRIAIVVAGRRVALLDQGALSDRLAARGTLRVRLDACPDALLARLEAIAPGTRRYDGHVVVPGPAASRVAAIEAIRASGRTIRGLSSEEARLDALYRELSQEEAP